MATTRTITPPPLSVLGVQLDQLTPEQKEALERMRKEFNGVDYVEKNTPGSTFALDDYTYVKYLRARNWDFHKAQQILHKSISWRNQLVPTTISATRPGLIVMTEIMGRTRSGHPVIYQAIEDFHPGDYTLENYIASRVYEIEEAYRVMALDGWKVDRYVIIYELKAFRFLKHSTPHAVRLYRALTDVTQSLYRDCVEKIILVNTFGAFQNLWHVLKHLLRPETAKRIVMIGDIGEIQEHIDPSNLYQTLYVDCFVVVCGREN